MLTEIPTVTLTNGVREPVRMPVIAAGTAGFKGPAATHAVATALRAGLTHVHTAFDYFNLPEIGEALAQWPRQRLFISSMTSPCSHQQRLQSGT